GVGAGRLRSRAGRRARLRRSGAAPHVGAAGRAGRAALARVPPGASAGLDRGQGLLRRARGGIRAPKRKGAGRFMSQAERIFDGRKNFAADDSVEAMLEEHFDRFAISRREIWRNFQLYTRRVFLKRFLAHYELFRQVMHLPGDIVELGVYRGASLLSWANFLEIRNMGDRHKRVVGFDNFAGFGELDEKDGAVVPELGKTSGGFDGGAFESQLKDAISIFDADRFIPYKARVELVKGDIERTVPEYVKRHPGLRIALLHFDV